MLGGCSRHFKWQDRRNGKRRGDNELVNSFQPFNCKLITQL
ncbi:hypothetical protein SynBIOSU31_01532 [Synechococcus sp. BIOS-U3-1]|nr:hypothetical protein SynBIOSU31_01532 [Synechococcus sp. BIOS-U3-1]